MGLFTTKKQEMVSADRALSGRSMSVAIPETHLVLGTPLQPPYPSGLRELYVAMGCFWGAERLFWTEPGVYTTAVGYMGGFTPNPTYEEVCSAKTGHAETVKVVYDPSVVSLERLLTVFFEGHDPTQHMRQGNDIGTQYRSAIFVNSEEELVHVKEAASRYDEALVAAGYGSLVTEMHLAKAFYYAEDYHQQYLAANPNGYCGLGGTGVSCQIGLGITADEDVATQP